MAIQRKCRAKVIGYEAIGAKLSFLEQRISLLALAVYLFCGKKRRSRSGTVCEIFVFNLDKQFDKEKTRYD